MKAAGVLLLCLLLAVASHSQTGQSDHDQLLNTLKASNAVLIEKQQKTLEQLEQLQREATALKIYAKRS